MCVCVWGRHLFSCYLHTEISGDVSNSHSVNDHIGANCLTIYTTRTTKEEYKCMGLLKIQAEANVVPKTDTAT